MSGRGVVLLVGLVSLAGLWAKEDRIEFHPHGPAAGMFSRSHPLRPNTFILVRWARDAAHGEEGWCVWATLPGEKPRYHLVLSGDGETFMGTRDDWWQR